MFFRHTGCPNTYSPHVTKNPAGLFSEACAACLFLSSNTSIENDMLLIRKCFLSLMHEEEAASLLSLPDGLEVAQLCIVDDVFRIDVVATAEESICPLCAEVATHVRSYYTRVVDDVPCAGHRVQLILHVRKFRCDTPTCPRKVFAERLGPFLEAWAP
jgi:hypothetical protein